MSSKSLDPISRRSKKATAKESVVPHSADASVVLEKAKAAIEAKKEAKSRSNRKLIFTVLVLALAIFLVGGGIMSWQVYQKDSQQREQDQTKQAVLESLKKFDPVKDYSDDDLNKLYDQVGAEYAAAEEIGIAPDPDNSSDVVLLKFATRTNNTPEAFAEAVNKLINARLEVAKKDGYYKGHIFYYWFGNSIANKYPNEKIDGWGDPSVLASDRSYADGRIKQDRDNLISNQISPNEIVAALNQDARLKPYDETNGSAHFDSLFIRKGSDDGRSESVMSLLKKYSNPGVTDIGTIVADFGEPASGKKQEVAFVFAYLEVAIPADKAEAIYQKEINDFKEGLK